MASADATTLNGSSSTNGGNANLSAAQKLMQNESHKPTIEDVPDEEDLAPHPHPVSSSILESTDEPESAPSWASPMSAKAAGKRKEDSSGSGRPQVLDTQSDELFPGLGGAPKPVQTIPSAWVSKKGPQATNGAKNGVSTNGTSTPVSDTNLPPTSQPSPRVAAPSLAGQISGKTYTFQPKELPRTATKKPLPDILREISKKHRVPLTQTTGEGGVIKITAGGNQTSESLKDPAVKERQALREIQAFKELGSQINSKVNAPAFF